VRVRTLAVQRGPTTLTTASDDGQAEAMENTEPRPGARSSNRALAVLIAVAAVAAIIVTVALVAPEDDTVVDSGGGGGGTTSTTGATTSSSPTSTTVPAISDTPLWPFPGSSTRYASAEDAARSFATEFLRFDSPVLEPFRAGDARSGEVPLRPRARGPITTVLVRQLGPDDDWSVLGATTEDIEVTDPIPFAEISSPVRVAGRARAFEGHVEVEVRADGDLGPIGAGFVTGGGDELRPFEGSIPFETASAPRGALVFFTRSAEDGQVWQAAAFRVGLRSTDADAASCAGNLPASRPEAPPGQMVVKVYLSCDADHGSLRAAYRLVEESPRVLRAALDALLAGPTAAERAASLSSWFSDSTAGKVRSVTTKDGHAVVDFDDLRPLIPNASTSAGSERLLRQLDATVFQFRSVTSVEYRIAGSCEDFNEWLQYGGCEARRRDAATD
jgi:hypothetical protein